MCRCGRFRQNEECWAERMQLDDSAVALWFLPKLKLIAVAIFEFLFSTFERQVFTLRLHSGVLCPDDTQTEKQPQLWNLSLGVQVVFVSSLWCYSHVSKYTYCCLAAKYHLMGAEKKTKGRAGCRFLCAIFTCFVFVWVCACITSVTIHTVWRFMW